jgi:hypothetical protein
MQCVYFAPDLARAQLVLDMLQQHGLIARVLNTHASTLAGEIPLFHAGPQVWVVHDRDVTAARSLIETMEATASSDASQRCAACGEDNPAGFELCWQCGAALTTASRD